MDAQALKRRAARGDAAATAAPRSRAARTGAATSGAARAAATARAKRGAAAASTRNAATATPSAPADALLARVAAEFDALPRQLKRIATYVEQHRASLMVDRTGDIAARCGVQPSAVVRFAQRFGFTGWSGMQAVFRAAYAEQATPMLSYQQRIRTLIDSKRGRLSGGDVAREFIAGSMHGLDELAAGLDDAQIEAAVALMVRAENLYVVGVRRAYPVAAYIAYALEHVDKRVLLVSGTGGMHREQMRSIRRDDVLIAISFTPYGSETQACVRHAHARGAKVVVLTDSRLSPLARHATALLAVKEGSAFAFRSLTSTLCLCQALFVALAYRLESNVEETRDRGDHDD